LLRGATTARGDPVIPTAQNAHRSWDFGEPHKRAPPPDFFGEFDDCIGAARMVAITMEKAISRNSSFGVRPSKALTRGLAKEPRLNCGVPKLEQPSRDARAKLAIGVEEKPAARVASFSIGVFVHQRDHGSARRFLSAIAEQCDDFPRSFATPFSVPAGMRRHFLEHPVITVRNSSMLSSRSRV